MLQTPNRKDRIQENLQKELSPLYLLVENESYQHQVPKGSELHFKVIAVSQSFDGLSLIGRHRLVNQLLNHEFKSGMHALSLHLYTPVEWLKRESVALPQSPPCQKKIRG